MDFFNNKKARLPKTLFSTETGRPFENCMVCNKSLLTAGTPYMIEKAFRQVPAMKLKEVIFEYALCLECSVKMNQSLSVESRQRLSEYFSNHVNFPKRAHAMFQREKQSVNSWMENCVIFGTPVKDCPEYQVVCYCEGKNVILSHFPFALSDKAIDELTSLLSAKSLGEIDDFMGKYFTGPPEVSAILKRRLVLI